MKTTKVIGVWVHRMKPSLHRLDVERLGPRCCYKGTEGPPVAAKVWVTQTDYGLLSVSKESMVGTSSEEMEARRRIDSGRLGYQRYPWNMV